VDAKGSDNTSALNETGGVGKSFYYLDQVEVPKGDLDGKLEGGKRFISMKEVQFLDEWEGDPGGDEQAEDEIVNAALAQQRVLALTAWPGLARARCC